MTDLRQPDATSASDWARRSRRGKTKRQPRRDIQGLRALAVLAVIANHLTDWPQGGFVGVDVFFVVSGFLITGLLLREHEQTGSISPRGFYARRARRILPAAVLVLVVTVVGSYLVFSATRATSILTDAVWALFFGSNWRFEQQATDYFAAGPVSPVQHYWSLSIEEQFYFVWPWMMLGILALLTRRGWTSTSSRAAAGATIGVITAASFAWALLQTDSSVASAYFSSFTRVWELGVGATLAVFATTCPRIPDRIRPALAWVGLVSIIASLFVIDPAQGFPAPAAAWPVLSTALVIAAGTGIGQQRGFQVLTNPVANYIGDMSYSLYLWHFPIIVLGAALIGEDVVDQVILAALIAAVSYFSFVLYEDRIRRGEPVENYRVNAMGALVTGVAVLALVALRPIEAPESALGRAGELQPPQTSSPSAQPETSGPALVALQAQIEQALTDTAWAEDLDPSMDEAINGPIADNDISECGAFPEGPAGPTDCAWGPAGAKHSAVLVGDSVALSFASALREATLAQGWRFLSRAATACPFADVAVNVGTPTENPGCPAVREAAIRDIKAVQPDVLFVVNHSWAPPNPPEDWVKATERELAKVEDAVGRVVYVTGIAPAPDPEECYTRGSSPVDCTGGPTEAWSNMVAAQQQLADEHGGLLVNTVEWFCFLDLCPPYVGRTPVRPDGVHALLAYTVKIQRVIDETLDRAGVFR